MILIVGLGNPGTEYEHTRHNVGWEVLDAIAARWGSGATWRTKRLLHARILECEVNGQRVVLAQPTTYMNESGRAVSALVRHLRLEVSSAHLIVVHDDLDLPVGDIRVGVGSRSGGQKGVQSTINHLGTKDFTRVRIGIGPNTTSDGHRIPAERFVLQKIARSERPAIDEAIAAAVTAIAAHAQ
ncbi:MAG: aminoacyl-tRNA hydrolase [bacterium]|nr:aminoacyl-tRNA hydrolase [bacterium]